MSIEELISRLNSGPSILFLGQSHLKLESGEDALLSQIGNKYLPKDVKPTSYRDILDTYVSNNFEEAVAWIQRRCMYIPLPKPLEAIAGFAWSGVFTSAIDDVCERAFRSEWRQVQPILDEKYVTSEPRNRQRLHFWRLFGSVSAPENSGFPPLKQQDLWGKQAIATVLANKIPELVTPIGVFVIEGYSPEHDWFSGEQIYAVINAMNSGQVHLFSVNDEIASNKYIKVLLHQGKVITYRESLAEALLHAFESGRIRLYEMPEDLEFGHRIRINERKINLPPNLWNQVSETAHLLTETVFLPLQHQSRDKRYSDFRSFLYESSSCPPWWGYARGFAFEREFEKTLREKVYEKLKTPQLRRNAVVLSGQTGTGKTVALGCLAYEIQKEGRFPVLFIERNAPRMRREAINDFCEWAEQQGASCTLIIWDGMQKPDDYSELLRYLRSFGRNVVLVGSCYISRKDEIIDIDCLEVPALLSSSELARFTKFIQDIDNELAEFITKRIPAKPEAFLVFLYRLLPPSRPAIRRGIEQELSFAEQIIADKAIDKDVNIEVRTILGQVLAKAGLTPTEKVLDVRPREVGRELITEMQEIYGLVMVPGQFNLSCPFELLLRSMNKSFSKELLKVLQSVDIFRWDEDAIGNIIIGPRSSLEARLIVEILMGGAQFEVEYATKLISSIRIAQFFERNELNFAVDLIRNLGPNGSRPQYYQPHYLALSQTLQQLRTERNVENARLMLQESMICRESAKLPENSGRFVALLGQSEEVCRKMLTATKNTPENKAFLSQIHAELASAYGFQATHAETKEKMLMLMQKTSKECFLAHSLDPENLHPIDVVSWTSRDMLLSPIFSEEERASLQVNVLHAFDLADSEGYQGEALVRLEVRKEEIFKILGQTLLSDAAFSTLLAKGSCVGIYTRAQRMVDFMYRQGGEFTESQRTQSKAAYDYLISFGNNIENDSKCNLLLLRTWWTWKSGTQIATGERNTLPFSEADWICLRTLLSRMVAMDELRNNLKLAYLKGLAYFHLKDFSAAFKAFKQLDYDSHHYGSRIIKHYLWADSKGVPYKVNGIVTQIDDKGRGEIFVKDYRLRITFYKRDSGREDLKQGDSLSNFRIAFSFRGPIADFKE